jgi:CheY-like chemotaxis protein
MKCKIMVVEDDPDIARNIKALLEMEGYEVISAADGQLALEGLAQTNQLPRLIILDLMMPVMDGFQFREAQLRDSRIANIPVAIMTADGHVDQKKMRTAANAALKKPAGIDDILRIVQAYCG